MNLRTAAEGSTIYRGRRWSENGANRCGFSSASDHSPARGRDYNGGQKFETIQSQTRRVPPPREYQREEPLQENGAAIRVEAIAKPDFKRVLKNDWLSRAFCWLRGRAPEPKSLRLAESVSLGEKRFVAIIQAEGHKYLVGGGASSVALLTELNQNQKPIESIESFTNLVEAAG